MIEPQGAQRCARDADLARARGRAREGGDQRGGDRGQKTEGGGGFYGFFWTGFQDVSFGRDKRIYPSMNSPRQSSEPAGLAGFFVLDV